MYAELVKALRQTDFSDGCPCEAQAMCKDADCVIIQAADAIEELSKPHWVPVTERLPTEKGRYLTAYADGYVTENEWCFIGLTAVGWYYDRDAVTHWMPLPQPPKEE